ncbi:MAG: carnitine dehydratase [Hyphomonas sp. BRH_c22]|uniref:CaiB/BaiF CoA transferase family protein n=1 Tax=Hyphomonas sp. BRH_c22 TaxID=1629710 RepID=UPI0005F250D7|nr:CaiB/BaiF CoA-transferase family protein [Hyphomonas sp. BRH_c22]KJS36380.1 MAG: carnitine dehydratase [Hyphomonas sp. BRH_c22]
MASGPLNGVKIVEFAGIGPGPFCGMLLSDMGADVIRIDRPGDGKPGRAADVMGRGRRSISLNLKDPADVETAMKLIEKADGLIEGFRPGVMERNGLGPDAVLARNPKLVYGRMTGWGQFGSLSQAAGHDLNYIALTGALHAMGRKGERPSPPLNLVGDYGGGALYLAMGLLAGIINVKNGGKGQVIDVAMTDGAASLSTMFFGMKAMGVWTDDRESNLLDGGAHFYDTYECSDGKWVSIGSIEPQFYALLLEKAGITDPEFKSQMDRSKWGSLKDKLIALFKTKTRDEWCAVMEGTDICFAPVLSMAEAPGHPHNAERKTFVEVEGVIQPAPAPRFSETPPEIQRRPAGIGEHTDEILRDWQVSR